MRSLLLGLSVLTAFVACSKHDHPGPDSPLFGSWRMVWSVGGIAGSTLYPPKDTTYTLNLNRDSTWQRYINDHLISSGTFTDEMNPGGPINPLPSLVFKPQDQYVTVVLRNDTLTLGDNFADGYTTVYVRSGK